MLYKIRLGIAILILITAILGITGVFYPIPLFDIQIAPLIQRIISDFTVITLVITIIILLLTLLFGRFYCSLLCPLGTIQEITALFRGEGNEETRKNLPVKYFITAITIGVMIGGSALLIRYLEPYTYFGSAFTLSIIGIIAVVAIIVLTVFKNRYFCTNICPAGCLLGLLSKLSLFKMYIDKKECLSCGMCERNCPSGCIDSGEQYIDNETCVKCLKCKGLCPKDAIKYGIKPREEVKFSLKRRSLIILGASLAVLMGAVKAGIETGKILGEKVKNLILPAGADNAQRMLNKCLNCNLCINACPSEILSKADESFNAVHIDYSKGKRFCEFDCKKCSEVCPSGAIKRITLEEKQNTRIAMAVINQESCNSCGACVNECPVNAITKQDNQKSVIDASKCIGCGKCKTVCGYNAIEVFAVNEQRVL